MRGISPLQLQPDLYPTRTNGTVLSFQSVQGRSDICEKQGVRQGWLNDETDRVVTVLDSFFWASLQSALNTGRNLSALRKSKGSLVKTDLLLMPINKRQNHWCLGGADMKKKKIMYYDPMGKCSDDFTEFSRNIRSFLSHRLENKELEDHNICRA